MCSDICEVVENVRRGAVFVVEDGGIWFSGMNADLGPLMERVSDGLKDAGYTVHPPEGDSVHAVDCGGLFLPVEEAEEVDDEIHDCLVSTPGGGR